MADHASDFDAAIADKDHARQVGDLHKVAKFWEAELDELHSDSPDMGPTEAQLEAAERADHEFREALASRVALLLRGCGFVRVKVDSETDGDEEGFKEIKYLVCALDTEGRRYDLEMSRPGKRGLGIEHSRDFLSELADKVAAELVIARDKYLARMCVERVAEVAS